jgi:hypothetical protein
MHTWWRLARTASSSSSSQTAKFSISERSSTGNCRCVMAALLCRANLASAIGSTRRQSRASRRTLGSSLKLSRGCEAAAVFAHANELHVPLYGWGCLLHGPRREDTRVFGDPAAYSSVSPLRPRCRRVSGFFAFRVPPSRMENAAI